MEEQEEQEVTEDIGRRGKKFVRWKSEPSGLGRRVAVLSMILNRESIVYSRDSPVS